MPQAKLGVIGGSGLYHIEGLGEVEEVRVKTPFGEPSDTITVGTLEGVRVAFLPRHGRGHRLLPSELPVKANIYALKSLGVERIISVSAVGSLKEDIRPLDFVIPDQLIDRTRGRAHTFFGGGLVVHVPFAEPFCPELSQVLHQATVGEGAQVHRGGTMVVIEGPFFSTRAESFLYRSWGADIIGMTALPEAKLAREAEICYATLAAVTDYDCWHQEYASVTIEMVISHLQKNVDRAQRVLRKLVKRLPEARGCSCGQALKNSIVTDPRAIPPRLRRDLAFLLDKYLPGGK